MPTSQRPDVELEAGYFQSAADAIAALEEYRDQDVTVELRITGWPPSESLDTQAPADPT